MQVPLPLFSAPCGCRSRAYSIPLQWPWSFNSNCDRSNPHPVTTPDRPPAAEEGSTPCGGRAKANYLVDFYNYTWMMAKLNQPHTRNNRELASAASAAPGEILPRQLAVKTSIMPPWQVPPQTESNSVANSGLCYEVLPQTSCPWACVWGWCWRQRAIDCSPHSCWLQRPSETYSPLTLETQCPVRTTEITPWLIRHNDVFPFRLDCFCGTSYTPLCLTYSWLVYIFDNLCEEL